MKLAIFGYLNDLPHALQNLFWLEQHENISKGPAKSNLLVLNYFCFPQTLQKAKTNNRLDSESRENIEGYKDFIKVDDTRGIYGGKGMHQSNRKTKSFCLFMSHTKANDVTGTETGWWQVCRCTYSRTHKLLKQARIHKQTRKHWLTQFDFSPWLLTIFKSQISFLSITIWFFLPRTTYIFQL